jgi:hypothetical protein
MLNPVNAFDCFIFFERFLDVYFSRTVQYLNAQVLFVKSVQTILNRYWHILHCIS